MVKHIRELVSKRLVEIRREEDNTRETPNRSSFLETLESFLMAYEAPIDFSDLALSGYLIEDLDYAISLVPAIAPYKYDLLAILEETRRDFGQTVQCFNCKRPINYLVKMKHRIHKNLFKYVCPLCGQVFIAAGYCEWESQKDDNGKQKEKAEFDKMLQNEKEEFNKMRQIEERDGIFCKRLLPELRKDDPSTVAQFLINELRVNTEVAEILTGAFLYIFRIGGKDQYDKQKYLLILRRYGIEPSLESAPKEH